MRRHEKLDLGKATKKIAEEEEEVINCFIMPCLTQLTQCLTLINLFSN